METNRYWKRTYPVRAVRITKENISDVAEQIGASYWEDHTRSGQAPYYHIASGSDIALVGDWVVSKEEGVYFFLSDEEFTKDYQSLEQRIASDEKFARVFKVVMGAMRAQDVATYFGDNQGEMSLIATKATEQILKGL
jgi:hypothetical protein